MVDAAQILRDDQALMQEMQTLRASGTPVPDEMVRRSLQLHDALWHALFPRLPVLRIEDIVYDKKV